jgi:hypothetical protein
MLSQVHVGALSYFCTGQVGPRFVKSGSLEEQKLCHNVMVEADVHLRLLHTSILDIYNITEHTQPPNSHTTMVLLSA